MSKKKKGKGKKREKKPLREWTQKDHFPIRVNGKKFRWDIINDIINERVAIAITAIPPTIRDWKCEDCGAPKRYITERDMPSEHDDYKIVGCVFCYKFITVYLNERKHGNTPIRPDQVAKGITRYNAPCCGVEINLSHKTIEQVREACRQDCKTRKVVK